MIGGEELVELGPDLRVRGPIRHENRYADEDDADRRSEPYDDLADSLGVAAAGGRHQKLTSNAAPDHGRRMGFVAHVDICVTSKPPFQMIYRSRAPKDYQSGAGMR